MVRHRVPQFLRGDDIFGQRRDGLTVSSNKQRLKTGFTIGGEQAEADPFSAEAFIESPVYHVIADKSDPRCFLIGRTGSGKSAAIQHLEEVNDGHVIRIAPEDLSLPYITDMQVIRYLDSLDVKLDLFWIALWKHVLLVEIIRHRYGVNSPEAKQRFLTGLKERLVRTPGKQAALEYLDEFEGKFWVDADERVREITDTFTKRIEARGGISLKAGPASTSAAAGRSTESSTEERSELADRYQRIVNETQLSKLNQMMNVLNDDILDDAHFTYVVIDDLDRDWVDERLSNDLIRCLFRTVLDMQRVKNLKVLVALRTNIFQELDFGGSGSQEEKFRALVLEMRWTRANLKELLDERVRVSGTKANLDAASIADLFPHPNKTRGSAVDYMFDRTLLRPRDAIAFTNQCLILGAGKVRLSWEDVKGAEGQYSTNRMLALRDEWKQTYPGIDSVIAKFRGSPARMTTLEFQTRLDDCMLLTADPAFKGVRWLTEMSQAMWDGGLDAPSWFQLYQPITALLYRVGLIGVASNNTAAPVFFSTEPLLAESESSLSRADFFHVHRMFQKALDVHLASETTNS
jgi:hypothetical protein